MNVQDALAAPIWLAVNWLLVRSMWRAVRRTVPEDSFAERVRHTLLLSWACVVGVATVQGALGVLSPVALLAGVAFLAVLVFPGLRFGAGSAAMNDPGAGDSLRDGMRQGAARCEANIERWCWLGWGGWLALCSGRVLVSGLLEYPTNWDTLTYHLPFVDQWLATGSLYVPGATKWFFPGNNELVALWMVAPFSGDFFAPLNNLVPTVLLVLSALEFGRLFGVAPLTRHLAVLALVSNYVVWHQVMDNKNDVATVSLLLSSLAYSFHWCLTRRPVDLLLAAVSLGLLSGVKYYALLYAGMIAVALVLLTLSCRGRRDALLAAAVCLAGLAIWGGYWYARNLWVSGMPLYPKGLPLQQIPDARVRPDLWSTTLLGNASEAKWPLWVQAVWRMTGPCHLAAVVLTPVSLFWLFLSGLALRRDSGRKSEGNLRWALMAITIGSAVLYGVTPFTIEVQAGTLNMVKTGYVTVRMGLCFLSLALLCSMILIHATFPFPAWWPASRVRRTPTFAVQGAAALTRSRIERGLWHACLLLGLGGIAFQFFVEHRLEGASFVIDRKLPRQSLDSVLVAEILFVVGLVAYLYRSHFIRNWRLLGLPVALAALAASGIGAGLLASRWHSGFANHYDELLETRTFTFLQESDPGPARICVLTQRSYPFAGSRRQCLVLQAHPTAAQPEGFRSRKAILEYLRDQRATIVVIPRTSSLWSDNNVDEWADQHPQVFATLLEDRTFILKRVNSQLFAEALAASGTGIAAKRSSLASASSAAEARGRIVTARH